MTNRMMRIWLGYIFECEPVAICDYGENSVLQVKYDLRALNLQKIYRGLRVIKNTIKKDEKCHAIGLIVYPGTLQIIFGPKEKLGKIGDAPEDYVIEIC